MEVVYFLTFSRNLKVKKTQDSFKILKKSTNVSFKTNNILLTFVKQHVIACSKCAFLCRRHMHYDELAIDQAPVQWCWTPDQASIRRSFSSYTSLRDIDKHAPAVFPYNNSFVYIRAKNYQNSAQFCKVIVRKEWCNFYGLPRIVTVAPYIHHINVNKNSEQHTTGTKRR